MNHYRILACLSAVTILAILSVFTTAAPCLASVGTISINPVSGPVDSVVSINGLGFTPSWQYIVNFGTTQVATGSIAGNGTILTSFYVPPYPRGSRLITVNTSAPDTSNSATFTITPKISLNSLSGHVGDRVPVSGAGFNANQNVTLYFDNANAGSVITNGSGSFYGTILTVPQSYQGSHTVKGKDASGYSPDVTFTIIPEITVTPSSATVGDKVTITGSGFTANSSITFYLDNLSISSSPTKTDASGSFSNNSFSIPEKAHGSYTLKARDHAAYSATATITVSQGITIDPEGGSSGTTVKVTGNGFGANRLITINYDGAKIITQPASIRTNGYGSFSATFTVPDSTSGIYVIKVSDGTYSAGIDFTIMTGASLNPTTGKVGVDIAVRGSSFTPTATVTVKYDGFEVVRTTSDAGGVFSADFEAPASCTGSHTVTVSDNVNTLILSFDIVPEATLSQNSGYVGSDITVRGTGFASNKTITIKYDAIQVGTAITDAAGTFNTTFKAPASRGGNHAVTFTDGVCTTTSIFAMDSTPPPVPTLLLPVDGTKADVFTEFSWTSVIDPSSVTYTLQIASDDVFSAVVLERTGLTTGGYTLSKEEKLKSVSKQKPYYWRVRATDAALNESTWTTCQSFYVGFVLPTWGIYTILGFVLGIGFLGFWLGRKRGAVFPRSPSSAQK